MITVIDRPEIKGRIAPGEPGFERPSASPDRTRARGRPLR
jgi:hypothetical protein